MASYSPERIRLFLWRLMHDGLITNHNRFQRRLATNGLCPRCQAQNEDRLHALRDCHFVTMVWLSLFNRNPPMNFSQNLNTWVESNMCSSSKRSSQWDITFAIALDSLWKARNLLVFEGKTTTRVATVMENRNRNIKVTRNLSDTSPSLTTLRQQMSRPVIAWSPPPVGSLCLNCDGAVEANGCRAACGGVVRDHTGRSIFCFSVSLGPSSVINAELWAIYYGLKILREKNIMDPIQIESDSALAILLLKDGVVQTHGSFNLLNRIIALAHDVNLESYRHIFHEANFVADALAKKGLSLEHGIHIFDTAPACAHLHLLADAANVHFRHGF